MPNRFLNKDEIRILKLITSGYSSKEIAKVLGKEKSIIDAMINNITNKLKRKVSNPH